MASLDNFKHHSKRPGRSKNSIDGFLAPGSFAKKSGSLNFADKKNDDYTSDKIDNFDRLDGYHPTMPAVTGSELSNPILSSEPRQRNHPIQPASKSKPPKKKHQRRRLFHRPKSWPKFIGKVLLGLFIVALLIGGYLGYKIYKTQRAVLRGGGQAAAVCDGNVPVNLLNKEGDSRVNVLLVGIGGKGHDGPDLTDTLIIASVDTINDKIDLVSVPRDLWVQGPTGGATKINAIYPNAKAASTARNDGVIRDGLKVLDKTLTGITGVDIHYNVLVDFKAFKQAVDAVGGVTFYVPEELNDPTIAWENKYNPVIAKKGTQTFNGNRALLYAKSRETSSDFARGERQRLLLVALKEKILTLGTYSNPIKVAKLLDSFGNNVYTDFDSTSIKCLYKQISEIQSSNIKSLDLVTPPHNLLTTGPIGGLSTVFPRAGLFNYGPIRDYLRLALKDSEIAKENASVVVLNGTNVAGAADKAASTLKSYGYNVTKVGDASSRNYQNTVLVDLRHGDKKYTLNYLQKRYKLKAVGKSPDSSFDTATTDFVIIIGADASSNN